MTEIPADDGNRAARSGAAPLREPTADRGPLHKVVVLIPTYNERENLPRIVERVRRHVPQVDVLVLDDNSPDGTGAVADELAGADPQVEVMHRPGKQGLGVAYLAGFDWALAHGYDAAVEMDADGSHQPEHLPAMLEAAARADLVIGSRWIAGGSVVNWPMHRKALSIGANIYTKVALGLPANDTTAGYRVYRASALRAIDLAGVRAQGYSFQVDMTRRAADAGLTIVEVPIQFVEREIGDSKMSMDIVREGFRNVAVWGVQKRSSQVRGAIARRREGTWHQL